MVKQNVKTIEAQRENIKAISEELKKHHPLIKGLFIGSKRHERSMFNRQIFLSIIIILTVSFLALFNKLSGETISGLIGVIIGYFIGNHI